MSKIQSSKNRKSTVIVALLLLLVVIGGYTYSRYVSSGTAKSTATIARWSVQIKEKDLDTYTTGAPLTADLTLTKNDYVADNVIAPGRAGTYTVEIDPAGSQVAIDYVIKVDEITGLTATNENIKVTGAKYWVGERTGEGTEAPVTGTNGATISETLDDVLANKKVIVEVTIEWENVDDEEANGKDTTNGKSADTATVQTSITAKQHIA